MNKKNSRFKLVKTNGILTANYQYTNNAYSLVKVPHLSSKLLDLKQKCKYQKLDSSTKLDDLLKRCREIGTSTSSTSSSNTTITTTTVKSSPTKTSNLKIIQSKYKLINRVSADKNNNLILRNNGYKIDNRSSTKSKNFIHLPFKYKLNNQQISKLVVKRASDTHASSAKIKINLYKLDRGREQTYCLFYNRFGKCFRGAQCKRVHDPKRVALCPRFLRGTCKLNNCPFFHVLSPEKLPLCSFYASGCCNKLKCPYSHVYNGENAQFCSEFAKGYCALGSSCTKSHLIMCPEYAKSKVCARGSKCPLIHQNKRTKIKKKQAINKGSQKTENKPDFGASFIPVECNETSESTVTRQETTVLKIRPNLSRKV